MLRVASSCGRIWDEMQKATFSRGTTQLKVAFTHW